MQYTRASMPASPAAQRRYIKSQKYTLLSRRENLSLSGEASARGIAQGQQAAQHCLCREGVLRTALGL
jgi:hypothetical protein